jgi:hypothetical protein
LWYVDGWILVAVEYGSCNINIVRAAYERTNKRRENSVRKHKPTAGSYNSH